MVLYGFPTRDERDTFEVLLGCGRRRAEARPRDSLGALAERVAPRARRRRSRRAHAGPRGRASAPRPGSLVDLKARLDVPIVDLVEAEGTNGTDPRAEVREALTGLGYAPDEVRAVIGQLPDDGAVEDLLRDALKRLATVR